MSGDSEIVVFYLPVCPNCDRVKAALQEAGISYGEMEGQAHPFRGG